MRNPSISDTDMQRVWKMYEDKSVSADEFRQVVFDIMLNARKTNHTMLDNLKNAGKDAVVTAFTRFQSAGHGHRAF